MMLFPARVSRNTGSLFVHWIQSTEGDSTGRFIEPSTSGNIYILIVYNYDSNTIYPVVILFHTKES